jgi:hypothetical protein
MLIADDPENSRKPKLLAAIEDVVFVKNNEYLNNPPSKFQF